MVSAKCYHFRAREGVTILMNDMWQSTVIDFGCAKFKFSRFKVWVMVYEPIKGDIEEKEKFWNDLQRVVDIGYECWEILIEGLEIRRLQA